MVKQALYCASIALILLPGCGGGYILSPASNRFDDVALCEARFEDVPLTLDAERDTSLSGSSLDERGCVFVYQTQLSLVEVSDFYINEMERQGWQLGSKLEFESERVLLFEKPHKRASVIISSADCTRVRAYVGLI